MAHWPPRGDHGKDLGGRVFIDEPAIGRLVASNLTRGQGGVQERYSDGLLARAVRHGIDEEGKPLLFMPPQEFHNFSDADPHGTDPVPADAEAGGP